MRPTLQLALSLPDSSFCTLTPLCLVQGSVHLLTNCVIYLLHTLLMFYPPRTRAQAELREEAPKGPRAGTARGGAQREFPAPPGRPWHPGAGPLISPKHLFLCAFDSTTRSGLSRLHLMQSGHFFFLNGRWFEMPKNFSSYKILPKVGSSDLKKKKILLCCCSKTEETDTRASQRLVPVY